MATRWLTATDKWGNESTSVFATITPFPTGAVDDGIAPKTPTNYSLTAGVLTARHVWTNPTASDFSFVKCYGSVSPNPFLSC